MKRIANVALAAAFVLLNVLIYLGYGPGELLWSLRLGSRGTVLQRGGSQSPGRQDEERFIETMTHWPGDRPRAAVYYLAGGDQARNRTGALVRSLTQLDTYFLRRYPYPVIIFHEADLLVHVENIRRVTGIEHLYFIQVRFELPPFLTAPVPALAPCTMKHTVGYRHMCRFQAKTVYEQRVMRHVQYVWRLDDDSYVTDYVTRDVFAEFHQGAHVYGYALTAWDSPACTRGLRPAVDAYIGERHIQPTFLPNLTDNFIFYNNFEVSRVSLWLSDEYRDYIEHVDRLGGIYYHRWGDAPIKTLAVAMFVPRHKLIKLDYISYEHQGYSTTKE